MKSFFLRQRLLIIALFTFAHSFSSAQVVINEFSCSNRNSYADNYGDFKDWVELYNTGTTQVDLSGYHLSDNDNNPTKWIIPAGTTIPAGGYVIFICSGRDEVSGGMIHTSYSLKQTKPEEIVFSDGLGTVIDELKLDTMLTKLGHGMGRTTDGAATWGLFTNPSPGAANGGAIQRYASTPILDQQAGYYTGSVTVNISSPDPNVAIHYTLNGDEPTAASPVVAGPINITQTTVLRAMAIDPDPNIPNSFIETNTYWINSPHILPIVSISGDELDDLLLGDGSLRPIGHIEYFDSVGTFLTEAGAEYNEHGNDSWAYDQRGFDLICRDEYGYNHAVEYNIFPTKDRDEFQRLIFKAAANDNYPFESGAHIRDSYVHHLSQVGKLKLDERSWAPCIIYVNGEYWGVYDVREKVDDHDFTKHYFDQDRYNIDFIKTWGGTWADYGDMNDWNNLYTFVTTNDMSIPANFEVADSLYNWKSLVDYVVLNSYIVCADWLNWNTAWWHGKDPAGDKKKFRYVLWDMDASFGHYVNYTGIPDQGATADPCDPESLSGGSDPEGHITMLLALMANPDVEQYYITRYADLSNTVFDCDYMQWMLDSMIAVIEPEMQMQIDRWGGTYAGWQAEVQELKDFIDDRCVEIQSGMIDCYQLSGPHDITVDVQPAGAGDVKINSITPNSYIWTGTYYGGINTLLEADANPGFVFDYWELDNHTVLPAIDTTDVAFALDTTDNIIAHFRIDGTPPTNPILEDYVLEIPNAFSPNGDGQNDELEIFASDIDEIELVVYNRWGQIVWKATSITEKWDGKADGTDLNTGVYAYKLYAKFTDNTEVIRGGNITLMR